MLLTQTADPALAGVVLPSGAGTLTIGPQAMEGNLQIHPGDTIKAGYDFTMPGAHAPAQVTVDNASITMVVTCSSGTTPPAITFGLPVQTYSDPAGSPDWFPSGDQSSPAVYQGSVIAPDLCAGGVMSNANGATFNATIFSTDTTDRVNFRFHYSDNTAGSWSATITASPTPTAKTLLTATLTPSLGLTLAVDHSSAIPGDTLTYSGTVTNTGATFTLTGDFTASATGSTTATVMSYWDDVATSFDSTTWTALAGTSAAQSGYTATVAPPIASGMTLTATAVPTTGVTYPTSGDPLLATTMAAGSSALWHYTASVPLTPSQVTTLLDPTKVKAVRNSFHLEVSPANPNITQPSIINVDFSSLFFGASPAPSGAITNVTVAVQPPSGSPIQITPAQVSGLASLAPGGAANYSATYQVPTVAGRGTTETEPAYVSRLKAIDGTALTASATASGSSTGGNVTTRAPAVSTTEHLPIMTITKSGPATITAGTTGTFPLALQNTGGASATGMAITDSVPSGTTGTVSGIPTTLAPGAASGSTKATFSVPVNQSAGNLTDTATLTWQDANSNSYGAISSMFTTQVQAANKLTITGGAGPNPTGASEAVTATLVDLNGQPVANQSVVLNVSGTNTQQSTVTTNAAGVAAFSYIGAKAGTDTLQASTANGVSSNTLIVTWFTPIQKVSSTAVQGNFYAEPSNPQSFAVTPQSVPDFGQTFPTIDFNPPAGTIPHSPASAPTDQTRPFTDVTTDVSGNYNGTIVAQGNNLQAGKGNLTNFDAVFTANLIVAQAGDVTFNFYVNDGFLFGVGNGAMRVSGVNENPPASNQSAIQGYPLMGAFNLVGAGTRSVTVHFPAAGTYPYELDYFEANGDALSLTMSVATFNPQTNPLSIYVGYADGLRPAGSVFPFPWNGSTGVTFQGCQGCTFDSGAIRIDNSGAQAVTIDSVTVDVAPAPGVSYCPSTTHFDIWPHSLTIPANQILILAGEAGANAGCGNPATFDLSDTSFYCGANTGIIPKVNVTTAGVTTTFNDSNQILNTGGRDSACNGNESESWQRIGGGGSTINVPLPPATTLALTPATVNGDTVGQTQTFTVAAMDATGQPVANLAVTLAIAGANGAGSLNGTTQIKGTTDSAGLARLSYVGTNAGTDTAQVTAFVMGLQALSNTVSVPWSLSSTPTGGTAPAPAITSPSPPDGATVTKPVPISATFTPPAGQSITSWSVTYQSQSASGPVTLASGSGTPPATLGVLDVTLLLNDTYVLTISATASGGGTQVLTTSVIVAGRLKLGRYVTTYQDLSVPVGGFQMDVRRVYDSIDKRAGDFGIGWHLELANFRVSTNRQLGAGGWTQYNSFCGIGLCLTAFRASVPHFVTVVFPDGHAEIFDFTPTGGTNVFLGGGAAFTARPGTTSTLQAVGDPSLTYTFDGNLYGSNGQAYNPTRFTLTTRDRRVLILDTAAGLVSETDASGNAITVDSLGVHSTLGPGSSPTPGPSVTFTRDTQGRITDINGPVTGEHYHYAYLTTPNELQAATDPMGNTRTYTYDPQSGNLQKSLDPNNQPIQTLMYDASGRLVSIANGSQPATTIATNVAAQQQAILDPNGKLSTVLNYDAVGDVTERDDAFNGRTLKTTYAFDAQGRTLSVTDPLQNTTSLQYDQNTGNVLSVSSAGRSWGFESYNSFSEPGLIRNPDGSIQVTYTYDATTGAVLSEQQPGANPTTFAYLPNGQLKSVTDPGGRTVGYTYDAVGHLATIADSLGRTIRVGIDSGGRVQSVTDQLGSQSLFDYNPDGTLSRITDARKNQWLYSYDVMGRVKQLTDPLQHSASYLYNDLGQVQQVTDRNGQITTYGYDVDGLLTKETRPGNDIVNFVFDPLGRLIETDNVSSHVDRAYDDASRLLSETTCANTGASSTACTSAPVGNQPSVGVSYSYFPDSKLKSVTSTDPATPAVQYSYDGFGRLASIKNGSQGPFTFSYDALGRLSSLSRPNGITDALGYDASGGLTNRDASLNGTAVARFDYSIEASTGRRLSMTDNTGTSNYAYYDNGTLQSASHPAGSGVANEAYTYDAAGNRSSGGQPSTYDAANRLQSNGSYSYAFDAEGNLTSKTPTAGGTGTTYTWNASHQLTKITYPDGTSSSYRYDPFGRRVAAVDNGQETRFVYDGVSVKADYNSANQLQTSYLRDLESTTSAGQPSLYLEDGLGHVRALTDSTGAITGTYSYNSFGLPSATNPRQNRQTFGGYQYDSASGLYDAGARYYDPTAGRFISEDPVASANAYPYAANDPINQVDVYGMQAAAEYATLLQTDANNAQCIAGVVASIAGPAISGAIFGLGGYAVNAEDVLATIQFGLTINAAACMAGQASGSHPCGAAAATLVIYVIGRTADVDNFRGRPGYRTFTPAGEYNWPENEAWLQEALRGRNPIIVASALTPENMRSAKYGLTGYGREMRYLWNNGVRPSARIPPGTVICP